ncbi:MAG: dioxygenase [Polyangiaceae bacterium]|nr:dioxygenase [Polyangiaceae bacterium]MCL4755279.1 hypothetical protein [Myxococcales bacterium]
MQSERTVSRRGALGALAGSVVAIGCGGSSQSEAKNGSGGAAGGGSGGASSGGASSGGTSSGGAASGGAASGGTGGNVASCKLTPTPGCKITDDNILGPYYKADAPFRADITDGKPGTLLRVSGTVYGCDCVTPLADAEVDIWQADDAGAYDNTGYVLRGRMKTDAQGRYELTTILPGLYLNGSTYRPRHIHYKVSHPEGTSLTTQLYFQGDPWIASDAFVKDSLIMPLVESIGPSGAKEYSVTFDVVLA